MREIREIIAFWEGRRGQPLALATLVAVRGSSFRRQGARMLVSATGDHVGGLSAGCIEEEVVVCAREVLHAGTPELLTFDTRRRFGCHGTIEIFVEPARNEVLQEIAECFQQRRICRLETITTGKSPGTRIASFETEAGSFVQTIQPPLRLILIGDGAEMLALQEHSAFLGWETLAMEVEQISTEMRDDRTAVVLATHNYGRDCAALRQLLPLGLNYLGLVGSRRRRDDILFDVMHDGLAMESALYAPAGLHLGADSPAEIALSIVAEIQGVFAAGTSQHLRDRKLPIHCHEADVVSCERSAD